MKKIINGKRYDTDTAKKIITYSNNLSVTDFRYYEETLYKKITGEYFLHGEGGGLTKYYSIIGDMHAYGEKIFPLTLEEAKLWAEKVMDADEYEEEFLLDDESEKVTFLLPAYLMERVKEDACEKDCTWTDIFIDMAKQYYKK